MSNLIFSYDPSVDVLTVNGTKYSGYLFREFGFNTQVGQILEIIKKEDGLVTITRHVSLEEALKFARE